MGSVTSFKKPNRRKGSRQARLPMAVALAIIGGSAAGYFVLPQLQTGALSGAFTMCRQPPHSNCVIDGDTFYMGSQAIRVADIDTPETHPPRCEYEAELGQRATDRLLELLNVGPFTLQSVGDRDEDRYGRKLRIVVRDGGSLGDVLVSEGLARTWTGRREPWCG